MNKRLKLHNELAKRLEEIGAPINLYFQPPESLKLKYPCIIYSKVRPNLDYADNKVYLKHDHYNLIIIDKDPDSEISDYLLTCFQTISEERRYTGDNLNHTVLDLYY